MSKDTKQQPPIDDLDCQSRWYRLNIDWDESEWLAELPWAVRACWVILLAHVKANGTRGVCREPNINRLAAAKDVPVTALQALVTAANEHGALRIQNGRWRIEKWVEYQGHDTTNAERQRRHREKQKLDQVQNSESNTPVTALRNTVTDETLTETTTVTMTETTTYGGCPDFDEVHDHFVKGKEGDELDEADALAHVFWNQMESAGWTDANGKPIKNWKRYLASWAPPKPKKPKLIEWTKEMMEKYAE